MFLDDPNLIRLADKVYLYENFFDKQEVDTMHKIIEDMEFDKFLESGPPIKPPNEYFREKFDNFTYRVAQECVLLHPFWVKIQDFIWPEYVIHPNLQMEEFPTGSYQDPHSDSPGELSTEELPLPDIWNDTKFVEWGTYAYFGNFTGGELYYPQHNLEIKVKPGDLIIGGAFNDYLHGVKTVTSGTRYVYHNYALKAEKNPGTFAVYKSDNYYRDILDLPEWPRPYGMKF